jgi:hypothetical protein
VARNDPLARQIRVVQFTDAEIRRICRLTSQEAERIVRTASQLRGEQVRLASLNAQMWLEVGDATRTGIERAALSATDYKALFDKELAARAGVSLPNWRASQLATAQEGVKALVSRKQNGYTLSQRVWRNSQAARRGLNDTINVGLTLGKSPAEIAKDVAKYVNPNVPGGASSAALRLGRTEVLNAYHTTSINNYKNTPWIGSCIWHLSGSHPRPDECNEYAEQGNLKNGKWSLDQVPAKPHPNCLCYITPVQMPVEEYAQRFKNGEFDDYIDNQLAVATG